MPFPASLPSHLESIALKLPSAEIPPAAVLRRIPSQELQAHAMTTAQIMKEVAQCLRGEKGKEVRKVVRKMKKEQVQTKRSIPF